MNKTHFTYISHETLTNFTYWSCALVSALRPIIFNIFVGGS